MDIKQIYESAGELTDDQSGVLELYEPRSSERLSLLMHLEAVLKDFEVHSTADTRAKRIGPWQSRTSNDKTEVFSCSIPLFHLRQYGKLAEHTPSTQISQTLLQMRYSGADRQQDLRQVICQRQGNNQCLHISYLWAIIINNGSVPVGPSVILTLTSSTWYLQIH